MQHFNELAKIVTFKLETSKLILQSFRFSTKVIDEFKLSLSLKLSNDKYRNQFCIVVVGSYGRMEASKESDFDAYVLYNQMPLSRINNVNKILAEIAKDAEISLSRGFKPIKLDDMVQNIGGRKDDNSKITNRILFLTESRCLYGEAFFKKAYSQVVNRYLWDVTRYQKKVPRFLLNDVIRYYRTICVDYEHKIFEENKDWAIRNVKLRFSRKGLYFGSIIILLNSLHFQGQDKIDYIRENLSKSFPEKISNVILYQYNYSKVNDILDSHKILDAYAWFLKMISLKRNRQILSRIKKREDRNKYQLFLQFRDKSDEFNDCLRDLLANGKWDHMNHIDYLIL